MFIFQASQIYTACHSDVNGGNNLKTDKYTAEHPITVCWAKINLRVMYELRIQQYSQNQLPL